VSDSAERNNARLPQSIRNLRPRQWPTIVMRVCLLCAGISCLTAVVGSYSGVSGDVLLVLATPAVVTTAATIVFAVAVMVCPPIQIVRLGESFEVITDRSRYQLADVSEIQFVTGPEQDYAETNTDDPIREVFIKGRGQFGPRQIHLTLGSADASRLTIWATEKEIRVAGADHFAL
jgi:hypothetical protein